MHITSLESGDDDVAHDICICVSLNIWFKIEAKRSREETHTTHQTSQSPYLHMKKGPRDAEQRLSSYY